jgi:hypothetical protein
MKDSREPLHRRRVLKAIAAGGTVLLAGCNRGNPYPNPPATAGQPTDAAGNPTDTAGQSTDAAGNPTDTAGQSTDAAGNPTDTAGQSTDTAGSEETPTATEAQTETPTATESQPTGTKEQSSGPPTVDLGAAGNYRILSKSGISTVPDSILTGNIGVSPIDSTAITGFSLTKDSSGEYATSDQVEGRVFAADYAAPTPSMLTTAVGDMEAAYSDAAGRSNPDVTELGGGDISGLTLDPGLYKWGTGVDINDDVTLKGSSDDTWIFQIAGGLTMASDTSVVRSGGASAKNIVWQVAERAALGTGAQFAGTLLTQTGVDVRTGASVNGRLYAQTDVTLEKATVTG